MRRSLLFIPGNRPNMIQNSEVLPADAIIFDLEDSVPAGEKDAARDLVARALRFLDFGPRERMVRINDLGSVEAKADLRAMVAAGVQTILLPKVGGAGTVKEADSLLSRAEREEGRQEGSTGLVALLETALGIEHALDAALASPRMTGLALGGRICRLTWAAPEPGKAGKFFTAGPAWSWRPRPQGLMPWIRPSLMSMMLRVVSRRHVLSKTWDSPASFAFPPLT